ncbi:MAG TPA: hypothetical protein VG826_05800 [Pirellulales bacterium]|nr:hypothetical protein [Pirellulales bacterium]
MDHAALIDRLAAGELDEALRRDLFIWLDDEPARWRRCALALLEARELEEAFGAWPSEALKPAVRLERARAVRLTRPTALFALAASVMVAFSLGAFARGFFVASGPAVVESVAPTDRKAPVAAADGEPAGGVVMKPATESDPRPTAVAAAPPGVRKPDLIPAYIRSQLERRGYQVTTRPAQLPVVFPDGRRKTVPVDELQLNYVGQRTY